MNTQRIGKFGEDIAEKYFKDNNYKIISRNIRFRFGEIDLLIEKDGELIFCEVKTRCNTLYGMPFESVTKSKLRKMKKAVRQILGKNFEKPWRFDVISIEISPLLKLKKLQHFQNILA